MTSGLCYTKELQEILVDQNNNSEITNNFLENAVFNQINSETNEYYRPIDLFNALRTYIEDNLNESGGFTYSTTEINNIINEYMNFYSYTSGSSVSLSTYLTLARNLGIDLLTEELKGHPNGSELIQIATDIYTQFISLNSRDSEEYKNCIKNLIAIFAYLNSYSSIQSIVIFPKDLTSKETLITYLESWNQIADDEYHAHNSNEIINYTDIVGDLTAMVGQMINIISIVLIIFASISLIVSCVMTGIITYVSVIERTKEIGILRSLGARKLDVGRLFVTESSFIGGNIKTVINNSEKDNNFGMFLDLSYMQSFFTPNFKLGVGVRNLGFYDNVFGKIDTDIVASLAYTKSDSSFNVSVQYAISVPSVSHEISVGLEAMIVDFNKLGLFKNKNSAWYEDLPENILDAPSAIQKRLSAKLPSGILARVGVGNKGASLGLSLYLDLFRLDYAIVFDNFSKDNISHNIGMSFMF